jgi:hypothetical protein
MSDDKNDDENEPASSFINENYCSFDENHVDPHFVSSICPYVVCFMFLDHIIVLDNGCLQK